MSLPPVEATPAVIFPVMNLNGTPPAMSPPSPLGPVASPPVAKSSRLSRTTLTALGVGAGMGGLVVLVAVAIFVFFYRRRKRKMLDALPTTKQDYFHAPKGDNTGSQSPNPTHQPGVHSAKSPESDPVIISSGESVVSEKPVSGEAFSTFSYEELARITDNFSNANLLGQGGFGFVHKGTLPNGKEVAIKQLKAGSGQGEREFQAEVETITRVDHKHLVQLHGHCICGEKRLLVYEYLSNNTLEFHLHGEGRPPLCWQTRLKIAVGTAKGLAYLHEECQPKIIHRDIKASNILLDDDFEVKVADFGLAKFSYDNDTHVSTRVMGTFGYLAPEYASSGKLTEKSDVFSFGVVLLELITGRRPVDKTHSFTDDSMVEWARPLLMEALETGNFDLLVDPKLEDYNPTEMTRMVACANVCVRQSARRRPRMSQIVRVLEGNLSTNDICKEKSPASSSIYGSSDFDHSLQYKEEMKKFRKLALDSQDLSTTSEFSAIASEYDNQPSTTTSTERDTKDMSAKRDGGDGYVIPIS